MKDSEKMSYLFRHREQEPDTEKTDKDVSGSDKKAKEKESDK